MFPQKHSNHTKFRSKLTSVQEESLFCNTQTNTWSLLNLHTGVTHCFRELIFLNIKIIFLIQICRDNYKYGISKSIPLKKCKHCDSVLLSKHCSVHLRIPTSPTQQHWLHQWCGLEWTLFLFNQWQREGVFRILFAESFEWLNRRGHVESPYMETVDTDFLIKNNPDLQAYNENNKTFACIHSCCEIIRNLPWEPWLLT